MVKLKRKLVLSALGVCLGAAYILVGQSAKEPTLRQRSHHERTVDGKITFFGYQWLPNESIVGERVNSRGYEVFSVDTDSGRETILRSNSPNGNGYAFEDRGMVSPDGSWRINTLEKELILTSLRDAKDVSVPNRTPRTNGPTAYARTVAWYPDGSHWVELACEQGKSVLLVRTQHSTQPRKFAVGATGREQSLIGITPDRRAILTTINGTNTRIVSVPLDNPGGIPHFYRMTPPAGLNLINQRAVLSPDGRRILWLVNAAPPVPWFEKILSRLGRSRRGENMTG